MFGHLRPSSKCILGCGLALVMLAGADVAHACCGFAVLYAFQGHEHADGASPAAGVIEDTTGNLYGTTRIGGSAGCGGSGCGTIFRVAPDNAETVVVSFAGGVDGALPVADLIMNKKGDLYGTTEEGGGTGCNGSGCGTVFKVAPDGTETVLYSFEGGSDGSSPLAGLIADSAGNLYGTTDEGGGTGCNGSGCGTVFKVARDGTETILYSFEGGSDGSSPRVGLIADSTGNFYGTTDEGGGTGCNGLGCGTVFKVAPDGTETVLHSFKGGSDGSSPLASLITDSAGNFYGTTLEGGSAGCNGLGCGTVFELAPDGTESVVHSFANYDGAQPSSKLLLDKSGDLYGTTLAGP